MSKLKKITNNPADQLKEFLCKALKEHRVGGVFALRRHKNGKINYALIHDTELINEIEPLYPLMPVNAGQVLSRFTEMKQPVIAVVRPCEFRAFVEMVKREQVRREDFVLITYSCGGVYPLGKDAVEEIDKYLENYWNALNKLEIPDEIRLTCKACEYVYHSEADIYLQLAGKEKTIWFQTKDAEEFAEFWEGEMMEAKFENSILQPLLDKRASEKEKIFAQIDTSENGLDGLIDIFGKCIGCHGCNSVCPICYCALCDFDSFNYDYNRPILEKELKQKGALRLPPDTLFFHLGRLSHMSFSCVGCGMCSDVCPANIPVASVFKRTGEQTAALFDFVAGRSVKEEIPVMIFKEEEFSELGE